MRAVRQRVSGQLLLGDEKNALLLDQVKPAKDAQNLIYLRYALVTRGPGDHIFPGFVLDDWGKERRNLGLYEWILENGDRFPRAEIFGFEADGRETQAFLRAMENFARFPCYAYMIDDPGVTGGHLISAVLLPDAQVTEPGRIKRPADLELPLSNARVSWWAVPPGTADFDLSLLEREPDPGY
ncbi:MAG: hypothetical protein ACK2T4_04120 [Candidatus Promineifilaceae bacterium]|jgi:hypothetical protein